MSHVTYQYVMSHINQSCHIWINWCRVWISHVRVVPDMNMTYSYQTRWLMDMWHDWLVCDMTHWYVTWLIDMWHDWLICDMTDWYVTWLIDMWHDSLICDMTHWDVTWLIHMWHDSFICYTFVGGISHSHVTWLDFMPGLIDMWHDSLICDMTHWYVTWLIHMLYIRWWHFSFTCDLTRLYARTYIGRMSSFQNFETIPSPLSLPIPPLLSPPSPTSFQGVLREISFES